MVPHFVPCRFQHNAPAAARYQMSAGCVCYPEDREQALCVQHIIRATPLGTMQLVEVLDVVLYSLVPSRLR